MARVRPASPSAASASEETPTQAGSELCPTCVPRTIQRPSSGWRCTSAIFLHCFSSHRPAGPALRRDLRQDRTCFLICAGPFEPPGVSAGDFLGRLMHGGLGGSTAPPKPVPLCPLPYTERPAWRGSSPSLPLWVAGVLRAGSGRQVRHLQTPGQVAGGGGPVPATRLGRRHHLSALVTCEQRAPFVAGKGVPISHMEPLCRK